MTTDANVPEGKAQHFVPRFYLKGFTDAERRLWVYEKFKPLRASKPKDEAHKPDYYTHSEQGERDETAEVTLEEIESRAAPIVRKLANPQFKPTPKEMGHVYVFIAFMFARVPSWREYLDKLFSRVAKERQLGIARDRNAFYDRCAEMEKVTGRPLGIDREELRQYALKGEYEIVQTSLAYKLGTMVQSALGIAEHLADFRYTVLYAPKEQFFLSSDSPVSTLLPDGNGGATIGVGFGWPNVLVYFPLNKRACLRLARKSQSAVKEICEEELFDINRLTMSTATQHVYAPEGYRKISRLFDQWGM